jgi:hypothetical protein
MQTRPRIRNAYQKIKVGDTVAYRNAGVRRTAIIASKGINGFLEAVCADGRPIKLLGCDIDAITPGAKESR